MKFTPFHLTLIILLTAIPTTVVFATHLDSKALSIEGSGFAINDDAIKSSEISIILLSQKGTISSSNLSVEEGIFTLNDSPYSLAKTTGSILRDGKYIRVNGVLVDSEKEIGTLNLFGKLIHESKNGLVYSFTGKIVLDKISYKTVYTSKISILTSSPKPSEVIEKSIETKILKGASNKDTVYYFSDTRTNIIPGTTITIINEDSVSHILLSGKESGDRHIPFISDGRINTGEIPAGASKKITFDEMGFYRIYDPDYPWINKIFYVFPSSDSQIIRQGNNQIGN